MALETSGALRADLYDNVDTNVTSIGDQGTTGLYTGNAVPLNLAVPKFTTGSSITMNKNVVFSSVDAGTLNIGTPGGSTTTAIVQTSTVNINQQINLSSSARLIGYTPVCYGGSGANCFTTGILNTLGANLLVVQLNGLGSYASVNDLTAVGGANTWSYLTGYTDGTNYIRYAYVFAPLTASVHYFNYSGGGTSGNGPSMLVWAFAGMVNTSGVFDVASGTNSLLSSPLQPGSITPNIGDLVFTGCAGPLANQITSASVDSAFLAASIATGGATEQAAAAYLLYAQGGALNPTITTSGMTACVPAIAAFKTATIIPAKLNTQASAAAGAGVNVPAGIAPTSPVNGDFWSTSSGFYGQVNGSTVGPFASSQASSRQSGCVRKKCRASRGDWLLLDCGEFERRLYM